MMTKIGIVTVTYNSEKDIKRLFESILIQEYSNLVVYLVDNNSKDETLNIVQNYRYKLNICIIKSKKNKGFAGGNNIGLTKAMEDGCELLFILNPDMELEKNCVEILAQRIINDEKIGVIGPVVLFGEVPGNIIQGFGSSANFRTQKKTSYFSNERLTGKIPPEIYVDFVLGGAMMVKSSVLRIVGLFEEDYFMYNDEIDIGYRIKKAGFLTLSLREAIVRHFHDFDIKNKNGYNMMYYYIIRNRFLYFKKYQLYTNLIVTLLLEIIDFPLKIIWALRRMRNISILKYYYWGLFDGMKGKKGCTDMNFD